MAGQTESTGFEDATNGGFGGDDLIAPDFGDDGEAVPDFDPDGTADAGEGEGEQQTGEATGAGDGDGGQASGEGEQQEATEAGDGAEATGEQAQAQANTHNRDKGLTQAQQRIATLERQQAEMLSLLRNMQAPAQQAQQSNQSSADTSAQQASPQEQADAFEDTRQLIANLEASEDLVDGKTVAGVLKNLVEKVGKQRAQPAMDQVEQLVQQRVQQEVQTFQQQQRAEAEAKAAQERYWQKGGTFEERSGLDPTVGQTLWKQVSDEVYQDASIPDDQVSAVAEQRFWLRVGEEKARRASQSQQASTQTRSQPDRPSQKPPTSTEGVTTKPRAASSAASSGKKAGGFVGFDEHIPEFDRPPL